MGIHYRTARHHHGWLRTHTQKGTHNADYNHTYHAGYDHWADYLAGHFRRKTTPVGQVEMEYRFENTIGGRLIAKLREEMSEVLEVPNSWLPESYHAASGSRTLASVEREFESRKTDVVSDHVELKANKADLIEIYAAQVERGEELFAA